jgi:hypothetical protein
LNWHTISCFTGGEKVVAPIFYLKMYFDSQVTERAHASHDLLYVPPPPAQPGNDKAVAALEGSKLVSRGGFQIIPQLFNKPSLLAMFDEACRLFGSASEEQRDEADTEEWRGGLPPRKLLSSAGGPVQDRLYQAPALQALLSELIGVPVQASSNRASYSYYCRTGDHLALHRDVERCDISLIVAVSDNTDRQEAGGALIVYPEHMHHPLSAIRQHPERGAVSLKLAPGESCILAGGMVPHLVRPVAAGQYRITAPMCFRVIGCR